MSSIKEDLTFEIGFYEGVLKRLPSDFLTVEILGSLYTEMGMIDEGLRMDRLATSLEPGNATARYNLACSLALKRKLAEALGELHKAVKLGYDDVEWMLKDPDLEGLRVLPEFRRIVEMVRGES